MGVPRTYRWQEEQWGGLARDRGTYDIPVGQPVPGSRYRRAYCCRCGCAMRVTKPAMRDWCDDCLPAVVSATLRVRVAELPREVRPLLPVDEEDEEGAGGWNAA